MARWGAHIPLRKADRLALGEVESQAGLLLAAWGRGGGGLSAHQCDGFVLEDRGTVRLFGGPRVDGMEAAQGQKAHGQM